LIADKKKKKEKKIRKEGGKKKKRFSLERQILIVANLIFIHKGGEEFCRGRRGREKRVVRPRLSITFL